MPSDFDKCVSDGGKVVTKNVNDKQYLHICYDKKGKPHAGEVRTKKKKSKEKSRKNLVQEGHILEEKLKELQETWNKRYHNS